jgi:hypothetical protein
MEKNRTGNQTICNQQVVGSIPSAGSLIANDLRNFTPATVHLIAHLSRVFKVLGSPFFALNGMTEVQQVNCSETFVHRVAEYGNRSPLHPRAGCS